MHHGTGIFYFILVLNKTGRELIGYRGYKMKCEVLEFSSFIQSYYQLVWTCETVLESG